MIQRLGGNFAGVVDPHQGRGVTALGGVGDRLVGPGGGVRSGGHIGRGHGPEAPVELLDQAVGEPQVANGRRRGRRLALGWILGSLEGHSTHIIGRSGRRSARKSSRFGFALAEPLGYHSRLSA